MLVCENDRIEAGRYYATGGNNCSFVGGPSSEE
jgi:hypothetical protein